MGAIRSSLIVWHSVSMCRGGHGLVVASCLFPALTGQQHESILSCETGLLAGPAGAPSASGPFVESLWRWVYHYCIWACYILDRSPVQGCNGWRLALGALMR